MSITPEAPRVSPPQPQKQRDGRQQLFGTLLDSRPTHTRSRTALVAAVLLHVALLALLVVVSRPFIPKLSQKLFQPITIIIPEEESAIEALRRTTAAVPTRAKPPTQEEGRTADPGLTFTPGTVAPIPQARPGPVTTEPDDGRASRANVPRSLAERLIPRMIDPRLSPRGSYAPTDQSPAAAVRERISDRLALYNDSVDAAADARRRLLDWTKKTKDGKAWGIGPDGRIHLGDITLPAIAFAPPAGRRDEINARNRDWAEIQAQANREFGRQEFKDRVKAIRARKDKEREEKRKETASAPITN